jgi:YHS domain-containing protein
MLAAAAPRRSSPGAPPPASRFVPLGGLWDDSQDHTGRKGEVMATATNPVGGMEIDTAAAAASEEYQGKTYYFCSEGCHQRFVAAPEQYAV